MSTVAPHELNLQLHLQRPTFALEVNLNLPANGITVLFGPSGSGKTSLLRCVAGLERATGRVTRGGEVWQDSARQRFTPTWQRALGYVFQEASLFEHLDVRQNLHYGLRRAGNRSKGDVLDAALQLLGIEHLLGRAVGSLSGGERQRVAIARALATQPKLLLLDEPLASLDVARRRDVLPWLERLRAELKIPMLYVTHSVDELARLADHLVMLEAGQVRACGPIAQALVSQAVAQAIGEEAGMLSTCVVLARSEHDHMAQVDLGGGARLWVRDQGLAVGQTVRVRILARDVSFTLSEHADTTIQNRLPGVLESIEPDAHPSQALARVRCGQALILGRVTHRAVQQLGLAPGVALWCQVKSAALIL
ncbi:MAG: molybdenum ABC transporter ATP-binding protein [Betaproteobacteria bacterium]